MAVQLSRFAIAKAEELSRLDDELQALATQAFAHVRGVPVPSATAFPEVPEAIRDAVRAALGAGLFPDLPWSSAHPVDSRKQTDAAHFDVSGTDNNDASDMDEIPLILRCKKARRQGATREDMQEAGIGHREEVPLQERPVGDLIRIIAGLDPDQPLDGCSRSASLGVAGPAAHKNPSASAAAAGPAPACQQTGPKRGQGRGPAGLSSHARAVKTGPPATANAHHAHATEASVQPRPDDGAAPPPPLHAGAADEEGSFDAESLRQQQQRVLEKQQQQDIGGAGPAAQHQAVQEPLGPEPHDSTQQQQHGHEERQDVAQEQHPVLQARKRAPLWLYQLLPNRSRPKPVGSRGQPLESERQPASKRPRRQGAPAAAAEAAAAAAAPVQPDAAEPSDPPTCTQQPLQDSSVSATTEQDRQQGRFDVEGAPGADALRSGEPSEPPLRPVPVSAPSASAASADEAQRASSLLSHDRSQPLGPLPPSGDAEALGQADGQYGERPGQQGAAAEEPVREAGQLGPAPEGPELRHQHQERPSAVSSPPLQSEPGSAQVQEPGVCADAAGHAGHGHGISGGPAIGAEPGNATHTASRRSCPKVGAPRPSGTADGGVTPPAAVEPAGLVQPAPAPSATVGPDSPPTSAVAGSADVVGTAPGPAAEAEAMMKEPQEVKAAESKPPALRGGRAKRQRPTPEAAEGLTAAEPDPHAGEHLMDMPLAKRNGRRPQPVAAARMAGVADVTADADGQAAGRPQASGHQRASGEAQAPAPVAAPDSNPTEAADAVARVAEDVSKQATEAAAGLEACAAAGVATGPQLASAAPPQPADGDIAEDCATAAKASVLAPPASVPGFRPPQSQPSSAAASPPDDVAANSERLHAPAAADHRAGATAAADAARAASADLAEPAQPPQPCDPAQPHSAPGPADSAAADGSAPPAAAHCNPAAAASGADAAAADSGTARLHQASARPAQTTTHGPPPSGAAGAPEAKPERRYKPVAPARRTAQARAAVSDLPSTHVQLAALAAAWMAGQHGASGGAGAEPHEGTAAPTAAAGGGSGSVQAAVSDAPGIAGAEAGAAGAETVTTTAADVVHEDAAGAAPSAPASRVQAGTQGAVQQPSHDSAGMPPCTDKTNGVAGGALPADNAPPSHDGASHSHARSPDVDPERGTFAAPAVPEAGAPVPAAAAAATIGTAASEPLEPGGGSDFGEYAPPPQPPCDTATSPVRAPAPGTAQDAAAGAEEEGAAAPHARWSAEPDSKGGEDERADADGDGLLSRRNSSGCGSGAEGTEGAGESSAQDRADGSAAGEGQAERSAGAAGGSDGREQDEEEDDAGMSPVEREEWRRRRAEIERQRAEAAAEREAARRARLAASAAAGVTAELERRMRQRLANHQQLATAAAAEAAAKEDIRTQVRDRLQERFWKALEERNLSKLLRQLDVLPKGASLRTPEQRSKALKIAKIRFHPDKVTGSLEDRVYAEEVSKLLNSWNWS
ncbi:hypothetical protein PLESTM_000913600 [Pleodorina starrii]|nr:hypothetical protein PLESTM_000913600 [Pleodorina starrii]